MNQLTMGAMRNEIAEPYDFSIGDLLGEAWQRVSGVKLSVWGAVLYIILISIAFSIGQYAANQLSNNSLILSGLIQLASAVVTFPLTIGLQYLGVRRSVDLPVRADQIFGMYQFWGKIIGLFILQTVILFVLMMLTGVLAGIISALAVSPTTRALLMLIPIILGLVTFYVSMSFFFAYLLIVEKRLGVWASYRASLSAFNQHWFKIIIAFILLMIIYVASIIALLVGLIWTIPLMINFNGILYRTAFGVEEARAAPKL